MRRVLLVLAMLALTPAGASALSCHWGRPCTWPVPSGGPRGSGAPQRAHGKPGTRLSTPTAHAAVVYGSPIPASSDPPSAAHPLYGIAADGLAGYNVAKDPAKFEALAHGSVLRIIVNPANTPSDASEIVAYALRAEAEGDRISLVMQWWDWQDWLPHVQALYRQDLRLYGPLHPWAVSIGNEQELGNGHSFASADYAAYWKVLAPLVRRALPHTILVAGEVSPWGYKWLVAALKLGLPGMQAIAGHPYRIRWWFSVTDFVKLAHHYHVQPWITEGAKLAGAQAWPDCAYNATWAKLDIGYYQRRPCEGYSGDVPLDQLGGTAVDLQWEIGSRELGPGSSQLPPPGQT